MIDYQKVGYGLDIIKGWGCGKKGGGGWRVLHSTVYSMINTHVLQRHEINKEHVIHQVIFNGLLLFLAHTYIFLSDDEFN